MLIKVTDEVLYHINRKKAIEMAVKDLEQNLKIATNLSKRKSDAKKRRLFSCPF